MGESPMRWAVLGATSRLYRGRIVPPLSVRSGHHVVVEASRGSDGSTQPYADALRRDDVEAVYIPLPNASHAPWIIRALEAGKHVLCEKPLTMTTASTDRMFDAARDAGKVLLEAYMWPHHPRNRMVLDLARESLGDLRFSHGRFTFHLSREGDHRFDERGGGALYDVGIYCLAPALLLAPREPVQVAATAVRNEHDADLSLSGWLDLGQGFTATADVSIQSVRNTALELTGTAGSLKIPSYLVPGPEEPSVIVVEHADDTITEHKAPGGQAYGEMFDQFKDVVRNGATPRWGEAESRLLARWIDALHAASRRVTPPS